MLTDEFKAARKANLLEASRCGDPPGECLNSTQGLFDLAEMVQPKSVLEIGSDRGVSTEVWLLFADEVVAVDPWADLPERELEFQERCGAYPNLTVIKGFSPDALKDLADGTFDMIYVDAVHEYQPVKDDVNASLRLLKKGGWMCGHDYRYQAAEGAALRQGFYPTDPNHRDYGNGWFSNNELDIVRAVNEMFGEENVKAFSEGSWAVQIV